jgi:L-amino acid N-acyltransferase YncA
LARSTDAGALAEIYRPAVAGSVISFEIDPPDAAEMGRRLAVTLQRLPWLVYERDGLVLGYAYASVHRERPAYQWSVDVSAYVGSESRRKGVGRALYASLFAALEVQGFRNAYAGITLPNAASEGLHAAVGFSPVGVYRGVGFKDGRWHDVGWYERPLASRDATPSPPRPLVDCVDDPLFTAALLAGAP